MLGVGFFLQTNFDFLTSHFWRNFFNNIQKVLLSWAQIWQDISPVIVFVKLWGFKGCHFGHFDQFGTINARYNSSYKRVSANLIRLRNLSKLFERSLFITIDLLQGTKSILLYFIWRDGGWFSLKKYQILEIFFHFDSFHLIFFVNTAP